MFLLSCACVSAFLNFCSRSALRLSDARKYPCARTETEEERRRRDSLESVKEKSLFEVVVFLPCYEMETESFILVLLLLLRPLLFFISLGKMGIYHFAMLLLRVPISLFSSLQQERFMSLLSS